MKNINRFAFLGVMLFKGLAAGAFFPIYTPFMEHHGMSFAQMGLVNFVFHISAVLDLPTGALADKYGRRKTYLAGTAFWIVSFLIYANSSSIEGFFLAEFIAAIGAALESDSLKSWLWNVENNKSAQKLNSQGNNVYKATSMATAIFSGWITASYGFGWGWYMAAAFALLGLFFGATFLLKAEASPKEKCVENTEVPKMNIAKVVKAVFENQESKAVVIYLVLLSISTKSIFMYWPQRSAELGLDTELRGLMVLAMSIPAIAGAALAGRNKYFSANSSGLLLLAITYSIGFLIAGLAQTFMVFLLGFIIAETAYGAEEPTFYTIFNKSVKDDDTRSTANSIKSTARMLGGAVGLIGLGSIADLTNVSTIWVISGVLMFALAIYIFTKRDVIHA